MNEFLKKNPVKWSELCFYIFFVSLLFAKGIGLYDGQTPFKLFLLVALCGWALKLIFTEYTWSEAALCVFLVLLGIAIYLNTHEKGALFCILLVCGMKGMEVKKVFQVGLITWILSFGGLFLLTSFHLVDSQFKVHDKLGLGRIIRWSLGYAHPNVLHISYLILACFIVYLMQDKFRFRTFATLMLLNLYVFMYSLSSTGFLAVTILLVLAYYWSIRKKFCKAEQILIQFCLPICILLSLVAPMIFKGRAFELVNKLVNNRLVLSKWFLENQSAQFLGVDTIDLVTSLRTMDNSYVFAWITYGIIFFMLTMIAYAILIFFKTREQDGISLCLILACLIAGVTEPFLFNTSFKNITLIFVGSMLFSGKLAGGKRKVSLLSKYDREFLIGLPDLGFISKSIKEAVLKYKKGLFLISLLLGVAAGGIYFVSVVMPERYIMPRTAFEDTGDIEETYHLSSQNDLPKAGDVILGYADEATDMVPFSGNIAVVERFRDTVCRAVVTAFLVYAVGSIGLWMNGRRKEQKSKE
ncbi:MAG: hypothetical protein HDR23_09700 [Lachnospiraceae bacterium]|nr:hypothetical protein [Lachnospiraceae bacterium]